MKKLIFATALLIATPVLAQNILPAAKPPVTLTFTQDELNALVGLLDAGVKAQGLNAVPAASRVIVKLQEALKPVAAAPGPGAAPEKKAEEKK